MFSMLVVGYLFLGGAGAGALVVLSLLECANAQRRFGYAADRTRLGRTFAGRAMGSLRVESSRHAGAPHYYEGGYSQAAALEARRRHGRGGISRALALPGAFFSYAWPACLLALALGVLCLVADLGRPDRLFVLILHPQPTAMTVGAYALVVALAVSVAFSVGATFDGIEITPAIVYALGCVGLLSGAVCAAYTGVLLSSLASILFWQTWLLPALFAVSSFSCGIALVMLAAAFVQARQVFVRPLRWLARADSALIVVEAVALAALVAWGLAGEGTRLAAHALFAGDLRWTFWGGVVVLGLAVPFAMERFVAHGNYSTQLLWVAMLVLVGGFVLRVCIVGTAAYDVTQMPDLMYGLAGSISGSAAV